MGRFIRRYVRSVDLAEDIFQDVWVLAWRRRGQLRDPERFLSWFYRIARNRIMEQSRKSRRGVQITLFGEMSDDDGDQPLDQRLRDERPDPSRQAQHNEWTGLVEREVQHLDPLAREMLALRYGADLGLREIAEILDKPLGTVIRRDPQGSYHVVFSVNTLAAEEPTSLAVDDTIIYVGESREGRLLRFTKSGQALGEISLEGLEDREIQGIDMDPDSGLFLILVPGRLLEHDFSGDLIRQSNVTQARRFADMSLHPDGGRIALYDEARAEIWIVDRDGRFIERGATPAFVPHGFRLGGA